LTAAQQQERLSRAEYLRSLEKSFAFERASGVIESECIADGEDETYWWDLDTAAEDLSQEVEYLESRGLLTRHPDNPNWVMLADNEDEPFCSGPAPAEAKKEEASMNKIEIAILAIVASAVVLGCSQKPELPSQSGAVWPAGSEGMRPCATPAAGVMVEPGQLIFAEGKLVPLCPGVDGRVDGRVLTVGEKKKKVRHIDTETEWNRPKTWVEPTTIVEMDGTRDRDLPEDVAQESEIQSFEREAREHMLPYEVDWWKANSCQGGICRVIVSVTADHVACSTPPVPLEQYEQTDLAVNISEKGGGQTKAFECVYPEPKMESPLPAELLVQRDRQQKGPTTFVGVQVDRPLFPGTSSGHVFKQNIAPVKVRSEHDELPDFEPAPSHLIHNPYYPPTAGEWTSYVLVAGNSRVILLGKEDADLLDSLSEWAPREDADGASGPEVIKDVERYIAVKNGVDLHPGCSASELPVQLDGSRYCPDQKPDTYWFSGHLLLVNIPAEAAR